MAIFAPSGAPLDLRNELERLRRVVADMEALARGEHPSRADLSDAPFINGWALGSRMTHCLMGYIAGHPVLESGRLVRTCELWVRAPSHGSARTLSRFYRLGMPYAGDGRDGE